MTGTYFGKIFQLYALGRNYGYTDEELQEAETKLGCSLPAALREYYRVLGKRDQVNDAHNRLLPPEDLYFSTDKTLVFYEENQAVAVWGFRKDDIQQEDPPVFGAYNNEFDDWFEDSPSTAAFLLSMAYWNAALGGLPHNAMTERLSAENVAFIEQHWEEQKNISYQFLRFFTHDHNQILVLTVDKDGAPNGLYLAANNKTEYKNIVDTLALQWQYRSDENDQDA
ncbi:SMI1/KNR4 family protein [uncultured Chitinophaga sp.]|uniref:SMI1/KNR4 family protein n=1 Tax=uncultured Chitinophaga sp. TaxID=339340 RepID=UPI0025DCB15E|nr:SMI1/KNR4 family protein [uncultured Chitinophaga sp.]